jgi:hypothetical protein
MGLSSNGGMQLDLFSRLIQTSILYLMPVLAVLFGERHRIRELSRPVLIYFLSIAGAMLITSVLTCRPGAASYHLLPFLPLIAHCYFWLRSELPSERRDVDLSRIAVPLVVTFCFYSISALGNVANAFRFVPQAYRGLAEIREVEKELAPRKVELGFGTSVGDPATWLRFQSVFDGQPYTLDGAATRDHQAAGIETPDATVRYIESCGTGSWLIPRGQEPFEALNPNLIFFMNEKRMIFSPRFRTAFNTHYRRTRSLKMFDVWTAIEPACASRAD